MFSVARLRSASSFCARAAACLGVLTLALGAAPVLAAPAASTIESPSFAVAYNAKGSSAVDDSGKVYAKVWVPRSKTGAIHLHGGLFAPVHSTTKSETIGARIGFNLGEPLLLGIMSNWTYQTKSLLQPVDTGLPSFQPQTVLAKVQAHLVPAMGFLQVTLWQGRLLVPYVGMGAGYEWLILEANDYRTGQYATRTYASFAWESYGGVGLRLSEGLRLDGEAYYNGGSLERDVPDENGVAFREAIDVKGVGVRIGLHAAY